ncbi:MAG: lipopolysaccharide biosynthesis protein, partial [Muribaculaceae bacterium]|nr:lipopolysaccharide biosynthesis protein [Muribaculaceae bacterium]
MAEDLKKETAKGVLWSGVERFASGGILFFANILLARILSPDDFGLLAVVAVFVQISQTFIDSGFSNALIQKKDRSQEDYSTVFIFNLVISIGFYLILYLCAPLVSHFFDSEKLTSLTRVIGLTLIVGALVSVHKTRLTVELRFKIQSLITLLASAASAVLSIFMAYKGFGVWSLVILSLMNISLQVILIYTFIKWRPSLMFSKRSFKRLFSYSSKLLGASLIHLLYKNIYPIVIGKKFTPLQLGYFNRADTFAMYIPSTVGQVFSRVAFPIFSRVQDNNERLRNAYSKYIFYASLIIFPIMVGMIVLAKPLTILILKEKWLPMVPMLQILCIDWMFDHLNMINLNVLYVKGRSDIAFRNEVIKKTLAF